MSLLPRQLQRPKTAFKTGDVIIPYPSAREITVFISIADNRATFALVSWFGRSVLKAHQARSQVGALGARAPPAIRVHPLALICAPPIGIEDLEVKDAEKF